MLFRLSQLCSPTQFEKDIKLYVLFNLNKRAKSPWHLGETNTSDGLGDGTKRICWLFLFKILLSNPFLGMFAFVLTPQIISTAL